MQSPRTPALPANLLGRVCRTRNRDRIERIINARPVDQTIRSSEELKKWKTQLPTLNPRPRTQQAALRRPIYSADDYDPSNKEYMSRTFTLYKQPPPPPVEVHDELNEMQQVIQTLGAIEPPRSIVYKQIKYQELLRLVKRTNVIFKKQIPFAILFEDAKASILENQKLLGFMISLQRKLCSFYTNMLENLLRFEVLALEAVEQDTTNDAIGATLNMLDSIRRTFVVFTVGEPRFNPKIEEIRCEMLARAESQQKAINEFSVKLQYQRVDSASLVQRHVRQINAFTAKLAKAISIDQMKTLFREQTELHELQLQQLVQLVPSFAKNQFSRELALFPGAIGVQIK